MQEWTTACTTEGLETKRHQENKKIVSTKMLFAPEGLHYDVGQAARTTINYTARRPTYSR